MLLSPWGFLSKNTGVGYLFSCMGSSQPKNQTHVSCAGRQIFIHCATREVPNYIYFKNIAFICLWIVSLKAPIWGNESFLVSCSCRKNFESFLQRHWAYGWLAAPDISRFHPGNETVLSEFSQGRAECPFLKAFSQGLRVGFSARWWALLSSLRGCVCERKVLFWLGGWANMSNPWGRSVYTVTSRLVWNSDMLGKWFSLCLPGVWCGFPYSKHISY